MSLTRRTFLNGAAALSVTGVLPVFGSVLQQNHGKMLGRQQSSRRLRHGWQFYQGPLDPAFQVWHSEELVKWEEVTLPHCFNQYDACDPDTPAYRGEGWYRTLLSIANPYAGGRTLLHFEGAGQSSKIYIGAAQVGAHNGGYDEFVVDITDAAGGKQNVQLAVMCTNARDILRMPSDLSDFTLYGGLYRAVHLVYLPAVSLEAVHTQVQWEPGKAADVRITARLYAPAASGGNLGLNVTIKDSEGKTIHTQQVVRSALWQGEQELLRMHINRPQTWSPESPLLYQCEVVVMHNEQSAELSHRFGITHTRWEDHGPFYLNGERVALRGTQRHEDHSGYAAAMPDELIRQELRMIKNMGANFLRLAHYQQSRLVLDMCDELGILIWEEVPWCRSGVLDETFQARGKAQLSTMIDQHRNHACVLLWGLGNEDDWPAEPGGENHEAIRTYMKELHDLSHHLDPLRMTSFRRCDFARDIPDVYSPSIWAGWYSGAYEEYRSALEEARPTVKHLFHAEWGADSHAGRHAEDPDPAMAHIVRGGSTAEKGLDYKLQGGSLRMAKDGEWSETYACDLFDWYLKTLEEMPWLAGSAQWVFKDFTTPLRVENPVPRVNQKGLVTRDMQPKEGYYVFQSYWAKEPMLRVYGHSWPVRWGHAGQERTVRVYSNCADVELFVNGRSLGKRYRNATDYPCAGLRWSTVFEEGDNQLRGVTKERGRTLEDIVHFRYETRSWDKPSQLALRVAGRNGRRTTFETELLDAKGVRCLDSRAVVRFSLAGEGKLIDNLGTPTAARVVQLYNGRAEITVEHTSSVSLAVHSEGMKAALLAI